MFYGDKEIRTREDNGDMTRVVFADESADVIRTKLLDLSVTEEPLDATGLRDKQMTRIAGDVLLVLYDWDIKVSDYEFLDTLVRTSLNEHRRAAAEKLWGKAQADVTMRDIDRIKRS